MTNATKRVAKPFLAVAVVVGLAFGSAGCTDEDIARVAIFQYFGAHFNTALKIAYCESRLQADAVSPGGSNIGLFQINKVHAGWIRAELGYTWTQLKDPYKNTRVAKIIYNRAGGWSPWRYCAARAGV